MRSYRFVHTADLHLDSPFRGLLHGAAHLVSTLRDATFDTYEKIIDLCIDRQVDALLIAGDVYDSADRSLGAQLRFVEGLRRLEAAGIRAFICHGNHDPLDGWEARVDFPSNVVRFGPEVSGEPLKPDDPASPLVYGISYPTREVRDNLVLGFPAPESGRYCIGLLHANVGTNTGHEPYAPCSLDDLADSGYDYWALGHVHTSVVLREQAPVVIYPGNPQGRHINERGERGVYIVEVDERGSTTYDFHALDAVRWARIEVDIEPLDDEQALLEAVDLGVDRACEAADGRPLLYRLRVYGRGSVHGALARPGFIDDLLEHVNGHFGARDPFAFCERIDDESAAMVDLDALRQAPDLLGDLLRLVTEIGGDDSEALEKLRTELELLYGHARARRYLGDRALSEVDMPALLVDAERLLVDEFLDARER